VDDSGQRAFSDAGQGYQFIHPLGQSHPIEIATSRVLAGGTLNLTIRELWSGWVWEQLQGLAGTNNIVDVFAVLAANPAYVSCQTVIQPPGNAAPRGKNYMNCFTLGERFITQGGTKSFEETIGTTQMVMSSRGWWTPAEIQSFGEQETWELTLTRGDERKVVEVTGEHRWFKRGRRPQKCYATEVITSGLRHGDALVSVYQPSQVSKILPSPQGVQAGIVFGDGSLQGKARNVSAVDLFGDKLTDLLKWFPANHTGVAAKANVDGLRVYGLPKAFKSAPDLSEGLEYLYGWLAGYVATDGTVNKDGHITITSSRRENMELVRDVCQLLGIATPGINTKTRTVAQGAYKDGTEYSLRLPTAEFDENFFLRGMHHERALPRLGDVEPREPWVVDSVRPTDRREEVACALVPDGHAFALEDNLLTGNCTIVDISDNDTITVGALAVTKGIVVAYTHSTAL
jgi:DNA primase